MSNRSLFEIEPDREILTIGIIYSVVSIVVLPIYALIIRALHVRSDLRENISYKLINLLNYSDLSQSVCHVLSGFFVIFPVLSIRIDVFIRIVGCTANTLWLASFVIMAILAVTRIGVAFYATKPTKWATWMKVSLSLGTVYILVVWITGCVTQNFKLDGVSWAYDMQVPLAALFANLELVLSFPTLLLSFCSYVMIIYSIYRKKRKTQSSKSRRTEIGILIQATILTVYMTTLIILWHNAESWFTMTNFTLASLNMIWVMFSYLNAALLITLNSGVRGEIVRTLCSRKVTRPVPRQTPQSQVGSSTLAMGK